jgi:DNA mismatch endonuclease, patch repair protein
MPRPCKPSPEERPVTDVFTPQKRSEVMARIRGKNTKLEIIVRSALHRMGYRFRLHRVDLPGKPDVYIAKTRTAVFVNGCFWHLHPGCRYARLPKSNVAFWTTKLLGNRKRDLKNYRKLRAANTRVAVLWECELERNLETLARYLLSKVER